MFNKKAQVGETVTWIVATVIIISILAITFFVAEFALNIKTVEESLQADTLVSKSFFSYLITPLGDERVYDEIKNSENLSEETGNLAVKIFKEFYEEEYGLGIWMGILRDGINGDRNDFFERKPSVSAEGRVSSSTRPSVSEKISLSGLKKLQLLGVKYGIRN